MPEVGTMGFGAPATTMVWRGTWSSTLAYRAGHVVRYNSALYIALRANQNSTPTGSLWTTLVLA